MRGLRMTAGAFGAWLRLLIHSAAEHAAVNHQKMASNIAGGIRSEKYCRADEFFHFTEAAHGRTSQKYLAALRAVKQAGMSQDKGATAD